MNDFFCFNEMYWWTVTLPSNMDKVPGTCDLKSRKWFNLFPQIWLHLSIFYLILPRTWPKSVKNIFDWYPFEHQSMEKMTKLANSLSFRRRCHFVSRMSSVSFLRASFSFYCAFIALCLCYWISLRSEAHRSHTTHLHSCVRLATTITPLHSRRARDYIFTKPIW